MSNQNESAELQEYKLSLLPQLDQAERWLMRVRESAAFKASAILGKIKREIIESVDSKLPPPAVPDGEGTSWATERCGRRKAPPGWFCIRDWNHEGPCAPVEDRQTEDDYVGYLRWIGDQDHRRLSVCNSEASGAFKVYRHPSKPTIPPAPETAKDWMRCDACDKPISYRAGVPGGWVHEDADQKSCERAVPKDGAIPVEVAPSEREGERVELPPLDLSKEELEAGKQYKLPESLQPDSLTDIYGWWVKLFSFLCAALMKRETQLLSALASLTQQRRFNREMQAASTLAEAAMTGGCGRPFDADQWTAACQAVLNARAKLAEMEERG